MSRWRFRHAAWLAIALCAGWVSVFLVSQPEKPGSAAHCEVSSKLVNSCRAWLGAATNNYPQADGDSKSQFLYHEQRIGRNLDIVHTYHPVGKNHLDSTDTHFALRDNTYLFANWKPTDKWAKAGGSDSATNAGIDQMAKSVKSLGAKKIFMTLNHEPENDVSGGAPGCSTFKGSAGTPAEYRAMWKNVRTRFNNLGATNVVWAMDYMNYPLWDCMVNDLYPGDDLVDWVVFNAYGQGNADFTANTERFYTLLSKNSSGNHNYKTKPWGIVEWGIRNATVSQHIGYFNQAKAAFTNNTFPNLKMLMIYDSKDKGSETGDNFRVAYDDKGNYQQGQADSYKALANSTRLSGDGGNTPPPPLPPAKDTVPPTIALTQPANNARLSGTITVKGTASDNVGVKAVTLRIDDKYIATDNTSPYSFKVDAGKYAKGSHAITLRAFDPTDNMGESNRVTVTFGAANSGGGGAPAPKSGTSPPPVTSITPGAPSTPGQPVPVTGTLVINPSMPGASVEVYIGGKKQPTNTVDTRQLPNGTYKITVIENGRPAITYVKVRNPLPLAAANHVRANAVPYSATTIAIAGLGFIWAFHPAPLLSRVEARLRKRQQRI